AGDDQGQKRELGGVTITRGDLTSPGPLQKGVYSLTCRSEIPPSSGRTRSKLGQHCFRRMDFPAPWCLNRGATIIMETDHEKAGSAWNYRWCRVLDGGPPLN